MNYINVSCTGSNGGSRWVCPSLVVTSGTEDDPRTCSSSTETNDVEIMLEEDRRKTCGKAAHTANLSIECVFKTVHK